MSLLADWQIRERVHAENMIAPFEECATRPGVLSYGLSSYGYDARLGRKFKIFTNAFGAVVDPKNFSPAAFVDVEADVCVIPPNSFVLGESVETLAVPRDILIICLGKSTYARCGLIVNVTPLEPEWRGKVTIEISNTTPLPAKVYANEGIMQLLFHRTEATCEMSYAAKKGRYQDQRGLTLPCVSQ
jgi:dCTP deaminase